MSIKFIKNLAIKTMEDAIRRHKELNSIARKAQAYYYNNDPNGLQISDKEYDEIYDEITRLEKEYNIFDTKSVTQTAGILPVKVKKGQEEKHEFPCLSQNKTKDTNELLNWLGDNEGVLSRKCDGLTICLSYDNGEFTKAVSRGDGIKGLNVSEFAKTQLCFPLTIKDKGHVVVRGEYLFTYKEFDRINNNLPLDQNKYSSPRNLASGTANQLDMNIARSRQGEFHVFELAKCSDFDKLKTYEDQLKWCKEQGFKIVEYKKVDKNNLLTELSKLESNVKSIGYPTDGLVLRINDNATADKLGYTGHAPRFSIAFKFKDDIYETYLRDISFQASRTGRINPVAIFDEVNLDGAKTTKATLNNLSFIKQYLGKPYVGQKIGVIRSNLVIPTIVQADKTAPKGAKFIETPKVCPSCGQPTSIKNDGSAEFLMCENPNCIAKQSKSLEKFASKSCMNIEGLSTKTIEDFIEAGYLTKFSDFYKLDKFKDEIINRQGYGKTSYDNIIKSVEKSKNVELYKFISALCITNVSNSTAKDICKHFNNDFDAIRNADEDDFMNINGIGMAAAGPLVEYFQNNKTEIDELLKYITFTNKGKANAFIAGTSNKLQGKSFCTTGKLITGKFKNRDELIEAVESNGGVWESSVKKGLDYLITNDASTGSSKLQKATQLGIKLITEQEFIDMIERK